jgi:hypothetical protein
MLYRLTYSGSQKSEVCPMPDAQCPMPYALCPVVPHLSEKGYKTAQKVKKVYNTRIADKRLLAQKIGF